MSGGYQKPASAEMRNPNAVIMDWLTDLISGQASLRSAPWNRLGIDNVVFISLRSAADQRKDGAADQAFACGMFRVIMLPASPGSFT
jgi:hypothetical protein